MNDENNSEKSLFQFKMEQATECITTFLLKRRISIDDQYPIISVLRKYFYHCQSSEFREFIWEAHNSRESIKTVFKRLIIILNDKFHFTDDEAIQVLDCLEMELLLQNCKALENLKYDDVNLETVLAENRELASFLIQPCTDECMNLSDYFVSSLDFSNEIENVLSNVSFLRQGKKSFAFA